MKVTIKLNHYQLIAVSSLLIKLYDLNFNEVEKSKKVAISVGLKLADTFDKKRKTILKKADLFEAKKLIKFTFDYYEAWALKNICVELFGWIDTEFKKFCVQKVIDKLDAKV